MHLETLKKSCQSKFDRSVVERAYKQENSSSNKVQSLTTVALAAIHAVKKRGRNARCAEIVRHAEPPAEMLHSTRARKLVSRSVNDRRLESRERWQTWTEDLRHPYEKAPAAFCDAARGMDP